MSIDLPLQKNSGCVGAMNENSGSEAGAHAQAFLSGSGWRLYFRKCILISYEAVPDTEISRTNQTCFRS